jgi:hypothetical protein
MNRVNQQLANANGSSLDDLITASLGNLINDSLEYIREQNLGTVMTQEEFDALEVNVRVSVPEMWTPKARLQMLKAVRKHDRVKIASLVSEPQACLSNYLHIINERRNTHGSKIVTGDCILVCDLGGGTADLTTFKATQDLSANSGLDAVNTATGSLSGSHNINEFLMELLKKRQVVKDAGSIDKFVESLSLSILDWEYLVIHSIERLKCPFKLGNIEDYDGSAKGNKKKDFFTIDQ